MLRNININKCLTLYDEINVKKLFKEFSVNRLICRDIKEYIQANNF